jgi:hypothetical protein
MELWTSKELQGPILKNFLHPALHTHTPLKLGLQILDKGGSERKQKTL